MTWSEIHGNDWIIPPARNKGKVEQVVPLTDSVIELLGPRDIENSGFVFSSDGGKRPFGGFSKAKAAVDATLAKVRRQDGRRGNAALGLSRPKAQRAQLDVASWRVPNDHAERVFGHVIPGVRGTYDRYAISPRKIGRAGKARRAGRAHSQAGRERCFVSEGA